MPLQARSFVILHSDADATGAMIAVTHKQVSLQPTPRRFFMSLWDIFFWIHSAQTDAVLARFQQEGSPKEALDRLYRWRADPWASTRTCYRYQRLKYEILVSMLPFRPYARALDIGCGLGGLTRQLAPCVDHILGIDLSPTAIAHARELSTDCANVQFEPADLLALDPQWEQQFNLVVLADVLYYLSPLSDELLKATVEQVGRLLLPGGLLLLVNHHFYFDFMPGAKMTRSIREAFRWSPSFHLMEEQWRPFYLSSLLGKRS